MNNPVKAPASSALVATSGSPNCVGHAAHLVCVTGTCVTGACVTAPPNDPEASGASRNDDLAQDDEQGSATLRNTHEQLLHNERLIVLGQLAAALAHQIRNPLGAISNAVALARRHIEDKPNGDSLGKQSTALEALAIANQEIWEANRIIGDLLDYARMRAPNPRAVLLDELVASALQTEALPSNVQLKLELSSVEVHVDQHQMTTALRNLFRNAREAMTGGGTLTLQSRLVEDWVELVVQDTGTGVDHQHRQMLFEPLVTSKPLGMGLGLPAARALIANQGGTLECVDADDEPGGHDIGSVSGARFVVRLPCRRQ